jgi:sugar/nucleoside kinase (ribokinase family)
LQKFSSMKLVSVGTVAFDSIETPFGQSGKIVGGAATFISLAASILLKKCGLISVVGDDFPQEMLQTMTQKGIDLSGLQIKKGEKSFYWAGRYHYDMNSRDTLVTDLNVLAGFSPIVPEAYQNCEYLMLGNLDPNVQMAVIQQLNSRPKLVVLDTMNFWMDIAMDALKEVLKKVDVLTINDSEARQLSGEHSLVKAARVILEMGPKILIVKKGEHGALLFQDNKVFFAPALPLEDVIDPTGAGDTFAGGFIGYLAQTDDISFDNLKRAIIVGSAMASFACEKFGTQRLLELSEADVSARVKEFVSLTDFQLEMV